MTYSGNGMRPQVGQIAKFQGQHVSCFQNDLGCNACFKSLLPARGTQTPLVAVFESGESVLRHGRAEVVTLALAEGQEIARDAHAHNVDAGVIAT